MKEGSLQIGPTPTENTRSLRPGDFSTLTQALDYAALGETGCNFYGSSGALSSVLTYRMLRKEGKALARRLLSLGLERGARVALIADTHPDFHRFFFACQYAGLVPVPLPCSPHLGNHEGYVAQLRALLVHCQATVALAPPGFASFLGEAGDGLNLRFIGSLEELFALPESPIHLNPLEPEELAYIQYTSGSTRFPRGVVITQKAALANLSSITQHGLLVRPGDRCVSWLPFYHDMGLVGFVLGPMASQLSVDYLGTRDFAMRPRQWLSLMSSGRGTISFSPSFGYELCVRRLRKDQVERFDLSAWRVAGVGAETTRPRPLMQFAELLAPSGFDKKAFVACYGLAECTLAVSFAPLGQGLEADRVDKNHLAMNEEALPLGSECSIGVEEHTTTFIKCGKPLPNVDVVIRDGEGRELPDRHCGTIYVRGSSVMLGYFSDPLETEKVLSPEGWLDTGDVGYQIQDHIVITGRKKDLIIINGRNIWPQDLEDLAELVAEVRPGDACAFSVTGPNEEDFAVMVVQSRESDSIKRADLIECLQSLIRRDLGVDCLIELVPPHTLPRTSSGKLSRSKSRGDFLKRVDWQDLAQTVIVSRNSHSASMA